MKKTKQLIEDKKSKKSRAQKEIEWSFKNLVKKNIRFDDFEPLA